MSDPGTRPDPWLDDPDIPMGCAMVESGKASGLLDANTAIGRARIPVGVTGVTVIGAGPEWDGAGPHPLIALAASLGVAEVPMQSNAVLVQPMMSPAAKPADGPYYPMRQLLDAVLARGVAA